MLQLLNLSELSDLRYFVYISIHINHFLLPKIFNAHGISKHFSVIWDRTMLNGFKPISVIPFFLLIKKKKSLYNLAKIKKGRCLWNVKGLKTYFAERQFVGRMILFENFMRSIFVYIYFFFPLRAWGITISLIHQLFRTLLYGPIFIYQ